MPGFANAEELKARYLAEAIETATPAARLTMLFDRLVLDLRRADDAFDSGDLKTISDNLIHAQEILLALHGTLVVEAWEGAAQLAALYDFLQRELLLVNMAKDRAKLVHVAGLVAQLAEAWHKAAETSAETPAEPVPAEVAGGVR